MVVFIMSQLDCLLPLEAEVEHHSNVRCISSDILDNKPVLALFIHSFLLAACPSVLLLWDLGERFWGLDGEGISLDG